MSDMAQQVPKSMFNAPDATLRAQQTGMTPNMTVGDFLMKAYGVSPDDPVSKFAQVLKGQVNTATMPGKMAAMNGQPGGMPRTQQAPPMASQGPQEQPGLQGLMSGMR